jgi:hypothetical protein
MKLFVVGLRRSGTTIVYDALREDPGLRCWYEPLREEDETVGGGSGARPDDAFAETREARERFRLESYPELHSELFNWGGPRDPAVELEAELPDHVRDLLAHLIESDDDVVIKETRLHHKLGAIAEVCPGAAVVHVVRDPRAVTASMLLGRRRRTDIYTDADTFFTARTGRRLWSSRAISERLIEQRRSPELPADIPDFLRPLLLWKSAIDTTADDGDRLFGDRFAMVRLEDLRADPHRELARMYAPFERPVPDAVTKWISKNIRRQSRVRYAEDPRWAKAARLLEMQPALERTGYAGLLELDLDPDVPLDLTPPEPRSRLAGFMGRARRRARRAEQPGRALD